MIDDKLKTQGDWVLLELLSAIATLSAVAIVAIDKIDVCGTIKVPKKTRGLLRSLEIISRNLRK